MGKNMLLEGLGRLSGQDKLLLKLLFGLALGALALGVLAGAGTALARAGFIDIAPLRGYRAMTVHGVIIFFYWLYFVQAAMLLAFSTVYTEPNGRIAARGFTWAGMVLMFLGLLLNLYAALSGLPLLYDAPPGLTARGAPGSGAFYLGYLALAVGLCLVAVAAVATALKPRFEGRISEWSVLSFASVAWAGLLMVSAVAAFNAFLPAALWAYGLAPMPSEYSTAWHVLFHNMHYLPLMATVLVWYALAEAATGVKSVFGPGFSKVVFALYLIFVPPTSLYHMFLEPDLAEPVRAAGSLLSLFISVPTVLVFLVIVASLEVHARAQGARGLFGWIRALPWHDPAIAAVGMAVINLALGGALSFVLIQEKLASLLSDTFFVPGYFHFLTVGTVTLTFLGALCYALPGLTGRGVWKPRLLARLPYLATLGLLFFGASGVTAGYLGAPRRTLEISFDGAAPGVWPILMGLVGAGAMLMTAALLLYLFGLMRSLLPDRTSSLPRETGLSRIDWSGTPLARERAWTGPLSVAVLIAGMGVFTVIAFELVRALPIVAAAGGDH